ncbi:RsmB/NOP family class I SAM-dependent RNA methyltransferase [Yoonia sp. 208BN28-4]|uniref:RsmB/NOP family class I SAM-dependent RNA methyltransferase n=1 Tax=Yoonia sp. 208BN28-4 TaxID=3126505 RepID=UPI0030A2B7D5
MTPAARVAAAIEIIDTILAGDPAEKALTGWARGNRFAGAKDRAAIRDHVFDVLRQKRSLTVAAGASDGRSLMIALCKVQGLPLEQLFSGEGYGPPALKDTETSPNHPVPDPHDAVDVPEWLWPYWSESLGDQAAAVGRVQQQRAPVFLRVNARQAQIDHAIDALAADGIDAIPHPSVATCLRVVTNPRRIKTSAAYQTGLVELQDAASQAAMLRLNVPKDARVLDYCAGGGGKALAIAALHDCSVTAHDISQERMRDIPARSDRAGIHIDLAANDSLKGADPFDLVLCDAPCSGSGTWRRTPDAKWTFTPEKLQLYNDLQREVLMKSASFTKPGGQVAYMTCSVLRSENDAIVDSFLETHGDWVSCDSVSLLPSDDWDGFYLNILQKSK